MKSLWPLKFTHYQLESVNTIENADKEQQDGDDEGDKRHQYAPDGVNEAVARQLLNGEEGHQQRQQIVVDFSPRTEAQERRQDVEDK